MIIGRLKELLWNENAKEWVISFTTKQNPVETFYRLKDRDVVIDIQKYSKKRSLDANALCWGTCKDIGDAMKPPLPKEEVYRRAIRHVGEYEPLPIKNEAVDTFIERWSSKGVGWFAEVIDDSKLKGYKLVFAYYGSSTYNTETMGRLIDFLIDEAEQIGIVIPLSKERESVLNAWSLRH